MLKIGHFRKLALLVILVFLAVLVFGCSPQETLEAPVVEEPAAEEPTEEPAAEEPAAEAKAEEPAAEAKAEEPAAETKTEETKKIYCALTENSRMGVPLKQYKFKILIKCPVRDSNKINPQAKSILFK